jgi:hypothetical protein
MTLRFLPLLAATVILAASSTAGVAKNAKSMNSPGHKMQRMGSVPGHPGASGYAPGHRMQAQKSRRGPGASSFAPGRNTTGSGSLR